MRILQFNSYADPVGGAEVYALALTSELRRRGHEVAFFGTMPDREGSEKGLRIVRRPRYDVALLTRDPVTLSALQETLREFQPDLIHIHNVYAMGLDVLECLGAFSVPVVQTVHDFSLLCPNSWCVLSDGTACTGGVGAKCFQNDCTKNYPYDAEVALHTLLRQRILASFVDLALCPSRYLTDLTKSSGVRDVQHLHYFIDPIPAEPVAERDSEHLVYIGRLEPEKGVEHLLEAMPTILAARPGARLTVIGSGSRSEALLERRDGLGLGSTVTFKSQVPRGELGHFYASATLCVLPSVWSENSPLVAYECLNAGLPMIASRIGGIPELAVDGEAGFTFTPRDAHDLAQKALRFLALSQSDRRRMSEAMRMRAGSFAVAPHVDHLEGRYRALVRERPKRTPLAVAVDADYLAVLERYGGERAHLARLYHQHVDYIGRLEGDMSHSKAESLRQVSALEELTRSVGELAGSLASERSRVEMLEGMGPRELVRRLKGALARKLRRQPLPPRR